MQRGRWSPDSSRCNHTLFQNRPLALLNDMLMYKGIISYSVLFGLNCFIIDNIKITPANQKGRVAFSHNHSGLSAMCLKRLLLEHHLWHTWKWNQQKEVSAFASAGGRRRMALERGVSCKDDHITLCGGLVQNPRFHHSNSPIRWCANPWYHEGIHGRWSFKVWHGPVVG